MAETNDKEALIAELAAARTRISGNYRALRYDFDVFPRVKSNIQRNPLAWFSGAAVIGLLLSKIIPERRSRHVTVRIPNRPTGTTQNAGKAAFLLTALKFALDFAKPTILRYLAARFRFPEPPRV